MTTQQVVEAALALLALIGFGYAARWRYEARLWQRNATMWSNAYRRDAGDAAQVRDTQRP